MMDKKMMTEIAEITHAFEEQLNKKIRAVYQEFGRDVAVNVMINLSANLMAKSLLIAPNDEITYIAANSVEASLKEGMAAIHTHVAINRAMGSTCSPQPPKKGRENT